MIKTLNGSEPHESWGGWRNFLDSCELRDMVTEGDGIVKGVIYYGKVNCNYILFDDGTLIENYGYHGTSLMKKIREEGMDVVLKKIKDCHNEIQKVIQERAKKT